MPRTARNLIGGHFYHVLNRGNSKQEVFHKKQDFIAFINLIKKAKEKHPISILAYCLMPNHFHFVVSPNEGNRLSKWMHWLTSTHARHYHYYYNTSGHIWQGRFKSFVIQNDYHIFSVLRYVEGNPVRAKLVSSAKNWPWSSHRERIGLEKKEILDRIPIELPKDWAKYVDDPLTGKELSEIQESIQRQTPYGYWGQSPIV
ncbi:MAG: transposase [Acidobacteriota bacterium]|nr:transposase [Acidobacteriota bacterium]